VRVIFAGTPPFAAQALEAIARAGHSIPLVLTQPDRPAGRGMRLTASAVANTADTLGLTVRKPASLRDPEAQALVRDAAADVMVVAAYGLLLPPAVLAIPRHGCLNIHASLLPRWRGAAPIQRAILAGDTTTGITIMQMDAGLDTGPMLLEKAMAIDPRDTTGSLTERLARLGAQAIVEALDGLGGLVPRAQDDSKATYAAKVVKGEARLDWAATSESLDRRVRAFNPSPGAEARVGDETVKVWEAEPVAAERPAAPGTLVSSHAELRVACGSGALRILVLQRPGGRRMAAAEFLRGKPLDPPTGSSRAKLQLPDS
jgi:methionyl-tRNA formyltransferase